MYFFKFILTIFLTLLLTNSLYARKLFCEDSNHYITNAYIGQYNSYFLAQEGSTSYSQLGDSTDKTFNKLTHLMVIYLFNKPEDDEGNDGYKSEKIKFDCECVSSCGPWSRSKNYAGVYLSIEKKLSP